MDSIDLSGLDIFESQPVHKSALPILCTASLGYSAPLIQRPPESIEKPGHLTTTCIHPGRLSAGPSQRSTIRSGLGHICSLMDSPARTLPSRQYLPYLARALSMDLVSLIKGIMALSFSSYSRIRASTSSALSAGTTTTPSLSPTM